MKTKLKEYAKEMGIDNLSIDILIVSHRYLRTLNLEMNSVREKAYQDAYNMALKRDSNLVPIDKLRSMTLEEICDMLLQRRI